MSMLNPFNCEIKILPGEKNAFNLCPLISLCDKKKRQKNHSCFPPTAIHVLCFWECEKESTIVVGVAILCGRHGVIIEFISAVVQRERNSGLFLWPLSKWVCSWSDKLQKGSFGKTLLFSAGIRLTLEIIHGLVPVCHIRGQTDYILQRVGRILELSSSRPRRH